MAVGTITFSNITWSSLNKTTISWTTDKSATGTASAFTTAHLDGQLLGVITIPSSTARPTNAYDVYLKDAYGVDYLAGMGANRSSTTTQAFSPCFHSATYRVTAVPVTGALNFVATNAGSNTSGTCVMFWR